MAARTLMLTGASGFIGQRLRLGLAQGWRVVAASRDAKGPDAIALDLADADSLRRAFDVTMPAAVVHAGGIADPDECERHPELAQRVNVRAVELLAALCAKAKVRLVHFSTDYVFGGEQGRYREDDEPRPISTYGKGKLQSECAALDDCPGCAVLRVSNCYGRPLGGRLAFLDHLRTRLAAGTPVPSFVDQWRTPTAADQLPEVVGRLASDEALRGVFHWGGADRVTRYDMNIIFCRAMGFDERLIVPARATEQRFVAPRPRDTSLDSSRLARALSLRPWSLQEGLSALGESAAAAHAARI
jgi:dTDP-4-dehydrorhamnose reductase